ncbi:hypothetical protein L7F22_064152 [Adiantum nelumboides]|nr:hypothetical protein [Adiantum nelumboides]
MREAWGSRLVVVVVALAGLMISCTPSESAAGRSHKPSHDVPLYVRMADTALQIWNSSGPARRCGTTREGCCSTASSKCGAAPTIPNTWPSCKTARMPSSQPTATFLVTTSRNTTWTTSAPAQSCSSCGSRPGIACIRRQPICCGINSKRIRVPRKAVSGTSSSTPTSCG